MNESDYRAVLAERIKAARRRDFKTVDKARQSAEVARGTWEKAEKGLPIKDFSLAAIEKALGWPEGYAQAILDGNDPGKSGLAESLGVSEEPRPRPQLGGLDAYLASIEDRLDDLESRMAIMENPYFANQANRARFMEAAREVRRSGQEYVKPALAADEDAHDPRDEAEETERST